MSQPSILLTGCTKNSIGDSLAREFARRGYRVYATARRIESMGDLADASPLITLLSLDITDNASLTAVHTRIAAETNGKLDILYHNAGFRALGMAIDEDPHGNDEKTFATNVLGVMSATRMFSELLIAAKGKVVFSGSVSGRVPQPSQAAYNASKAALEMYARILRWELAPLGVRVVLVMTGGVRTNMSVQRLTLAEASPYREIEGKINEAWKSTESEGTATEIYARTVVEKVVQTNPPEVVWCGTDSRLVWLVELLGLRWVYGFTLRGKYGLDKPLSVKNKPSL